MANREQLTILRQLIEEAWQHALHLNEEMVAYLLSMAELEITENLDEIATGDTHVTGQ